MCSVNTVAIDQRAWHAAQFGPGGFYTDPAMSPADHFRTSSMIAGPLVRHLWSLITETDEQLGHPDCFDVCDVGAGDAHLLNELSRTLMDQPPSLRQRIRLFGVDLRPRPAALAPNVAWTIGPAPAAVPNGIVGLLLAFELLDDIPTSHRLPIPIPERHATATTAGLTPPTRARRVVPARVDDERRWPGQCSRRQFAADLVRRLDRGTAIFVDYPDAPSRSAPGDQIVGFRRGRQVPAAADGATNLTSGVDFATLGDQLADLGLVTLAQQHEILANCPPPTDSGDMERLAWFSDLSELTDPLTLGSHRWLTVQRAEATRG